MAAATTTAGRKVVGNILWVGIRETRKFLVAEGSERDFHHVLTQK